MVLPTQQYGRTVADVLAFLPKADLVFLAVPVIDGTVTYIQVTPAIARDVISVLPQDDAMRCEWQPYTRQLVVGLWVAIERATRQREAG